MLYLFSRSAVAWLDKSYPHGAELMSFMQEVIIDNGTAYTLINKQLSQSNKCVDGACVPIQFYYRFAAQRQKKAIEWRNAKGTL